MEKLNVKFLERESEYFIYIGENILSLVENYLKKHEKVLLLTNTTIGEIYNFKKMFENEKKIDIFEISDGEEFKNQDTVESIYKFLLEKGYQRNTLILTVGGGVVCDIGGYVASTYMRGVDFLQVPTSLLAMVDASIGGKVGINFGQRKNIIGSFYQPIAVIIDISFLKTLPEKEFRSGMGEVIKHSLISKNKDYFEYLYNYSKKIKEHSSETLLEIIKKSCEIKRDIIINDEKEKGERIVLNLGHTYGHALESILEFKTFSHGESISKGILFELYMFNPERIELIDEIKKLFNLYDIDSEPIKINSDRLIEIMQDDKKNSNGNIKFLNLQNLGRINCETGTKEMIEKTYIHLKNELQAMIDIGSNSIRMLIGEVQIEKNGIKKVINSCFSETIITSLGKGVNQNKKLSDESIKNSILAIKKFDKIAKSYGVTKIMANATSAVRDSENREVFLTEVKKLGIKTKVITGDEEARLSYIGVSSVYPKEKIMIIDIGGGSTEISFGIGTNIEYVKSFNIGAVRITEMFFQDKNHNENITEESIQKAQNYIEDVLKEISKYKDEEYKLIGVAGTVTTHISVEKEMESYNSKEIDKSILKRETILNNLIKFQNSSLNERGNIKGLELKRAPYVIAGSCIIIKILELLEKDSLIVSEVDNLTGGLLNS
jgi:exopolyphosphatase/guanosine-5'-triphosphate,3'-diphosphate pyrophosphatase